MTTVRCTSPFLTSPSQIAPSQGSAPSRTAALSRNKRCLRERGAGKVALLVGLVVGLVAFLALIFTFGVVVPPGRMGVRQIYFNTIIGPKQGFSDRALQPGYHGNIPFLATIHLLPSTVLPIHFNAERSERPGEYVLPPLTVKTSDGVTVNLDLTVMVQLRSAPDDQGGAGPHSLLVNVGTSPDSWVQMIRTTTNKHMVEALKSLTVEDFYDHNKRVNCEESGAKALRAALAPVGLEVKSVLLRRFVYENKQIEEAIFQKNIQQVQHVLGLKRRELAAEETITAKRITEIDQDISVLRKNAQVTADALREQAQATLMKARVEGEAMVTLARASIDKQRAQLLATTDGADMYLARQLTPILASLKGGIITDVNPYDLKAWVNVLGPSSATSPHEPSPHQAAAAAPATQRPLKELRREAIPLPQIAPDPAKAPFSNTSEGN